MEILGIGPGEFVLILIVLLVVVGPERLPGLARQVGSFLVRARNWLQTSPDAALVMRARAEIEAELASIKNSLMEVQVVRDEVLGAAKQLEDSVGSISPPKFDLNSLVNSPAEQTIAANGQALPAGTASDLVLADGTTPASIPLDQLSTLELPGSTVPIPSPAEAQPTNGLANGSTHTGAVPGPTLGATPAPTPGDLESINIRLQAIMADIWALQEQLKQHGALDQNWQPPSFDVQLPAQETAPLAGGDVSPEPLLSEEPIEAPAEEPIEDPVVLAARKRLEELTPMNVSYHAPPPIEQVSADSVASAVAVVEASVAETSTDLPALVDPLAALAPKPRKRRASSTASQKASDSAEPTVEGAPEPKTRKRRAPAASAERADETEPVTTEKAS